MLVVCPARSQKRRRLRNPPGIGKSAVELPRRQRHRQHRAVLQGKVVGAEAVVVAEQPLHRGRQRIRSERDPDVETGTGPGQDMDCPTGVVDDVVKRPGDTRSI